LFRECDYHSNYKTVDEAGAGLYDLTSCMINVGEKDFSQRLSFFEMVVSFFFIFYV
jgi:hypothetical protein